MKNILIPAILLQGFVALGQTSAEGEKGNNHTLPTQDWNTLNHPSYSIQYPPTWELNEGGLMGTRFILFSSLESDKDQFKENVNLIIQDLSGLEINLNQYTELSEGQIKLLVTNAALIDSKRIQNGSEEYHKIIYSGDQGIFHFIFEQFYWVTPDQAFVLTFTCEKDKFEDFKALGERILLSFSLKK